MKIIETIQGSEEWENLRRIRPTASRFDEIATSVKGDLSKSAPIYAVEISTQQRFQFAPDPPKWIGNANTDNGQEREAQAREAFSSKTGLQVEQVGFCIEDCGFYGCSPDGLIKGADGEWIAGIEIKCPTSTIHMQRLIGESELPSNYVQQVHGSMIVTGLRTWYFVSYFPGLPLFMLKVEWNEYTDKLKRTLDDFRILYAETRKKVDERLRIGAGEEAA